MIGISVLIPYRNRNSCLLRCLPPLFNQKTDFPWEVVFVDHGSTDGCIDKLIDTYADKITERKLVVCRFNNPAGGFNLARSRNIGYLFSQYELLFTFDIDSICRSESLLQRLRDDWVAFEMIAEKHGVGALISYSAQYLTKSEKIDYANLPYRKYGLVMRTVGWGNCLFHNSIVSLVGGWDHEKFCGKGYEDLAFFLLAFRQGCYSIQDPFTLKRKNNSWLTNYKDKDLPKPKRVEMHDVWEGGGDSRAMLKSYKKFRALVEKSPKVMGVNVDWNTLRSEVEVIRG